MDFLKEADKNCYLVVVGTKSDLIKESSELRQVTEEEGKSFAEGYNAVFYETSSKEGTNVSAVFDNIGYHCLAEKLAATEQTPSTANSRLPASSARSSPPPSNDGRSFSCCSIQ